MVAQLDPAYREVGASRVVRLASWALFEGRPLTTRGRAWNPVVLGMHRLHRRLPRLADVERPVFIMGMGRSGTTLVGKILSAHRDVGFLNEPKALWHVAIGDEDVVGSYGRGAARYRLAAADADAAARRDLPRLAGAYLFWTRRARLVDKNPEVVYRVPFVRTIFPRARFLLIVRNGWEVCRSVERWSRQHRSIRRGEVHDWWGADRRKWRLLLDQVAVDEPDLAPGVGAMRDWVDQRQMASVEWTLAMRYGLREIEASPDTVGLVGYERLLDDPERTVRRLLDFCLLDPDERVLEYATRTVRSPAEPRPFDLEGEIDEAFRGVLDRLGYAGR